MKSASFLVACLLLAPRPAYTCSLFPYPLSRSANHFFFLATALTDTVLARAGDVRASVGGGHSGFSKKRREIYGQRARLERVGEPWVGALPSGTTDIVLVPWDYGADCSTTAWGPSFRWMEPGTRGLFSATLRDRRHWVEGRPTFDVFHPDFVYPWGRNLKYVEHATDPALSLDEALTLFERLPEHSALLAGAPDVLAPLEAWAREHPALARRSPAGSVLRFLRYEVAYTRLRATPSPFAGTFRFVITMPGNDTTVLYTRTQWRPDDFLMPWKEPGTPRNEDEEREPEGYHLMADWERSERALPTRSDGSRFLSLTVALQPVVETADSTIWRGDATVLEAAEHVFGDDWERPRRRTLILARPRDPECYGMPGTWIQHRDGRLAFQWITAEGKVVVRGQRISTDTLVPRTRN